MSRSVEPSVEKIDQIDLKLDSKVQDVISKLRFLSKIDKHEKLDVASLSLVADTWYNNLYRLVKYVAAIRGIYWKSEESRKISLEFIKTTTSEALNLAKELFSQSPQLDNGVNLNTSLGHMIITTLEELGPGIQGLKKTYANDGMFISQVETFEDVLKAQIQDLQRFAPKLKSSPESISKLRSSSSIKNSVSEGSPKENADIEVRPRHVWNDDNPFDNNELED